MILILIKNINYFKIIKKMKMKKIKYFTEKTLIKIIKI